jgi:hypothetical protein
MLRFLSYFKQSEESQRNNCTKTRVLYSRRFWIMDKTSSRKSATTSPTTDDLVGMVQALKQDFEKQRTELEQKVARLEGELARTRPTTAPQAASQPVVTTSRRNMLKKLAAGAAGAAVIGATLNATNTPTASAATGDTNLNFAGFGSGVAGENDAYGTTLIRIRTGQSPGPNYTIAKPLLKAQNTFSSAGTGADPDNLAIGLFGDSALSHGVYGRSGNNSGVVGVVGTNNLGSNDIFANNVGGVAGIGGLDAGSNAYGVVGMSFKNSGVLGVAISSEGVKGVSQRGIGGAFAGGFDTDPELGAPLRLAVAKMADLPGVTKPHNSGEIIFTRSGMLALCVAGYTPPAVPGDVGTDSVDGNVPAIFEPGIVNPDRANWRRIPCFIFRNGAPAKNAAGEFTGDGDYHPAGEFWIDIASGTIHCCTRNGVDSSKNPNFLARNPTFPQTGGVAQKAIFKQIGGDIPRLNFLRVADRWVDSRISGNNELQRGITVPVVNDNQYSVQITGVPGRNNEVVPVGAKAVMGIVSAILTDSPTGLLKVGPGSLDMRANGVANCTWFNFQQSTAGPFFSTLDASGKLNVYVLGSFKPPVLTTPINRGGGIVLEIGAYVM